MAGNALFGLRRCRKNTQLGAYKQRPETFNTEKRKSAVLYSCLLQKTKYQSVKCVQYR